MPSEVGSSASSSASGGNSDPNCFEETSASSAAESTSKQDSLYYYECKIFLVERCFFQVPIHFLAAESELFQTMMELPVLPNEEEEGLSKSNPIILERVLEDDFRQLLRVLCPAKRFNAPVEKLSLSQWVSVLKLADQWCMDAVRAHAIAAMEGLPDIDPVDKVVIARTYEIQPWLAPLFNEILRRAKSFTETDVQKLGLSTVLRLMGLRDRLGHYAHSYPRAQSAWKLFDKRPFVDVNFEEIIIAEFLEECGPRRQA